MILLIVSYVLIKFFNSDIMNNNKIISQNISNNIDAYLNEPLDILKAADTAIEKGGNAANTLNNVLNNNKIFKKIEVLNKNGLVINFSPSKSSVLGDNRSNEDYFKAAVTNSVYLSGNLNSNTKSSPTILMECSGTKYILIGYIDLKDLSNSYKNIIQDGIEISVIDKNGIYISNYNVNLVNKSADNNEFQNIKEGNGSYIYKDVNNKKTILSYSDVKLPGGHVIVRQPYYPAMKPIFILIASISALVLLLISAMAVFLHYLEIHFEKSFNNLASQTSLVAKGKYEKNITMNSFVEFNYLADNINQMITKINERDKRLKEMAYYDYLTGLPNRTNLIIQMEKYIKYTNESHKGFGLLYLDIDDFRRVNDTYGHKAGDQLLIEFGKRINFEQDDKISSFSLGKDEFVILIKDIEDRIEMESYLKYIIENFNKPIKYEEKEIYFSVSIGVTLYPKDGNNYNELLQYADIAMYVAKGKGRNNYKFFNGMMRDEVKKKLDIERNLRRALSKNEFILYYQPQINIDNQSIKGFEALIRWNNCEMGFLNPKEFINICEETNMIIPISNWIIEDACRTIKKINKKYEENYTISINISPIQLKYDNFIPELKEIISREEINPKLVELEITENVLINSYNEILDILYKIKDIGVKISLDDFGTGYSSFSYLKSMPIDFLKIDKAFVNNIDKDNKDLKLIKSIINMAHDLNMKVIAEGIETFSQLNQIEKNSCDIVQGYVYSKPIPEGSLEEYIIKYNREYNSSKLVNLD